MRSSLNAINSLTHAEGARRARLEARTSAMQLGFRLAGYFLPSLEARTRGVARGLGPRNDDFLHEAPKEDKV
jgi:hypothetical protein